jgi:hypothetical protein
LTALNHPTDRAAVDGARSAGARATAVLLRRAAAVLDGSVAAILVDGGESATGAHELRLRGLLTSATSDERITTWTAADAVSLSCSARSLLGVTLTSNEPVSGTVRGLSAERPVGSATYAVAAPIRSEREPIGVLYVGFDVEPQQPDELRRLATAYAALAPLCLPEVSGATLRESAELASRAEREARYFAGSAAADGRGDGFFGEVIREMRAMPSGP